MCLAHELENHKIDFRIIDENVNYSSKVAAGMTNPMTFRRMIKTWKGDELIPTLKSYYRKIENNIGHRFFFPIKLRRAFVSAHERELWVQQLDETDNSAYVNPVESVEGSPYYFHHTLGNVFINTPGCVDAEKFMQHIHEYFLQNKK